jgi:hypothetical protein
MCLPVNCPIYKRGLLCQLGTVSLLPTTSTAKETPPQCSCSRCCGCWAAAGSEPASCCYCQPPLLSSCGYQVVPQKLLGCCLQRVPCCYCRLPLLPLSGNPAAAAVAFATTAAAASSADAVVVPGMGRPQAPQVLRGSQSTPPATKRSVRHSTQQQQQQQQQSSSSSSCSRAAAALQQQKH